MVTKELIEFIEAEFQAGQTREGLIAMLLGAGGWTQADIDEALREYDRLHAPVSVAGLRATAPAHEPLQPLHFPPAMQANGGESRQEGEKKADPLPPPSAQIANLPSSQPHTQAPAEGKFASMTIAESWKLHPPTSPQTPQTPASMQSGGAPDIKKENAGAAFDQPLQTPEKKGPFSPIAPSASASLPVAGAAPGGSLRATRGPRMKRIAAALGGALVVFLLIGGGAYLLLTRMAPESDMTFATMYASIPGIQSFRYAGETKLVFSGEVVDALKAGFENGYSGTANVSIKYDGRTDLTKGIDGVHQLGITAELRSGDYNVSVNSSVEARLIGDTYYLRITNPPALRDIDLSRLKTYWIAISPRDIAEYFGGQVPIDEDEYGSFGGASTTDSLRSRIAALPPLEAAERVGEEVLGGAQTIHYRFRSNPANLLAIIRYVVEEAAGKPWLLDQGEEENILAILGGISGDIWIDSATYLPRRIVLNQPLRGIVSGIRVDGVLDVEQAYSEYNGEVKVQAPRPVMTYEEFADDVRRQAARAKATGDDRRIIDADEIAAALEVYRANHDDRYPLSLDALVDDGLLKIVPKDPEGGAYLYGAYAVSGKPEKKNACTDASPTCAFYHLGVTLSDPKKEELATDADLLGDIVTGADTRGCAKEAGKACYDLVAPLE